MDAAFEAHLRVDVFAAHERDALLVAAARALAQREHLDLPALRLRIPRVHAEEIRREQRGLFASLATADLEDDILLVVGIGRQEQELDLALERGALGLQLGKLE